MAKTAKNILSLNHEKAMDFFMKSEQYHGFELPEYFTFDEVLKFMSLQLGGFGMKSTKIGKTNYYINVQLVNLILNMYS